MEFNIEAIHSETNDKINLFNSLFIQQFHNIHNEVSNSNAMLGIVIIGVARKFNDTFHFDRATKNK